MMLTLIGIVVVSGLIGLGVAVLAKNVGFRRTTERYRYSETKDENGNVITKVIDLEDEK